MIKTIFVKLDNGASLEKRMEESDLEEALDELNKLLDGRVFEVRIDGELTSIRSN